MSSWPWPRTSQRDLRSRSRPARSRGCRSRACWPPNRLVLLERDDLRLDDEEAMALLSGAGRKRPMEEVRELNVAAEGWPAGLYLTGPDDAIPGWQAP